MTEERPDDEEITQLLSALEAKTPDYPAALLASRRASYQQGLAGLGIGLVAAGAAEGGLLYGAWSVDNILKALIVVAMLVEGAGGAIMYRQRLTENITSLPTATLTGPLPPTATPSPTRTATRTASATATLRPFFTSGPTGPRPTDRGRHLGQTPTPPAKRTRTP
jgi:hypothetical protein